MTVSIMELATHVLGREATTGQDFIDAQLPMMGGCQVCGAAIAAYNAYPSQSGYLRCEDHIDGEGWEDVEICRQDLFED